MTTIVTDAGFAPDPTGWPGIDLAGEADPAELPSLDGVGAVRIVFGAGADGRGFTLARLLRDRGFAGRLRAAGPLIADQYAMARRSGFDEVEISDQTAARQPEEQWLFRAATWTRHDYQSRLRGRAAFPA